MDELHEMIDKIYSLLSAIPVRGDDVEIMAAVRDQLRRAYRLTGGEKAADNG